MTALPVALLALLLLAFLPSGHANHHLWPEQGQRLRVGAKLFPACLGADQHLAEKITPEGELRLLIVHRDSAGSAAEVAQGLRAVGRIAGLPLRVEVIDSETLAGYRGGRIAGLFLASPGADGDQLAGWPERFQALVFSPFLGDVERGAVAGVQVTDRILPYVNLPQAERAGVRFKPFFLRAAKIHD